MGNDGYLQPYVEKGEGRAPEDGPERKKARKSRWGAEEDKVQVPTISASMPTGLSAKQEEEYLMQLRIETISQKLRTNNVVPPDHERSPSPPPQYDGSGNRTNTREKRYRRKLEEERYELVEQMKKRSESFRAPADVKRPLKLREKVYVPVKEFPDINFMGQLLGPRGNTLKKMEQQSGPGVKIFIRGRGTQKEGKMSNDPDDDDDMHVIVTADNEDKVRRALNAVIEVIEIAKTVPEAHNERKRNQLRELAALNGTLRDDENISCRNCGGTGHQARDCPDRRNVTAGISCHLCGGTGHLRRDCHLNRPGAAAAQAQQPATPIDREYHSLLAELGHAVPAGVQADNTVGGISSLPPLPPGMSFPWPPTWPGMPPMPDGSAQQMPAGWPAMPPMPWGWMPPQPPPS